MTYDDGILTLYDATNIAESGNMPVYEHVKRGDYHFQFETVGYQRYYTAMKADRLIEHIVDVPDWITVEPESTVVMEDGERYRIQFAQRTYDDDGLKMTRLTLEKVGDWHAGTIGEN